MTSRHQVIFIIIFTLISLGGCAQRTHLATSGQVERADSIAKFGDIYAAAYERHDVDKIVNMMDWSRLAITKWIQTADKNSIINEKDINEYACHIKALAKGEIGSHMVEFRKDHVVMPSKTIDCKILNVSGTSITVNYVLKIPNEETLLYITLPLVINSEDKIMLEAMDDQSFPSFVRWRASGNTPL